MNSKRSYSRAKQIAQLAFWTISLAFIVFQFYLLTPPQITFHYHAVLKALVLNLGFAWAVYINLRLLIPRFLKQKEYAFYTLGLILTLSSASLLIEFLFLYPFHFTVKDNPGFQQLDITGFTTFFFASFFYVLVSSLAKFAADWIELQKLSVRLTRQSVRNWKRS